MKPIIIDMKDMSDSTEVYESRPSRVLTGFIYLILGMVTAALVWMGVCRMDIVVKGTGTIAAVDEVATVTNQVAGTIEGRMIEDGQYVEKGDVLYTVSHEELSLQLSALEKQLADCQEKEEMLKAYEDWLQKGQEFPAEVTDNLYYTEIASRKMLVELGEKSTLQNYTKELSAYETKLSANMTLTDYYKNAITKSRQLIEAVKNRNNTFGSDETYYFNYMENYTAQYQNTLAQYDEKIADLQKESEELGKAIETLEAAKQSGTGNRTNFSQNAGTVSGSDAMYHLSQPDQQAQNTEEQLTAQRAAKETVDKSIEQYNTQKNSALNAYEKESIAAIENSILNYEQNLTAYEGTQLEYAGGKNTLKKQGTELEVKNLVTQEQYSVAEELESCRQSLLQLTQQTEGIRQNVENATVKATISGKVNFAADLVEGDYIAAGTRVLSIIPESDTGAFVVKSYVENKDIAKIQEGMEVTYEIGAYPSREYGTMKGKVTFVSADLKVNNSGSAYYVVETSVDAGQLHNRLGEEATLKVGMLCETKIVVDEKSVLEVLLEKIFHI